MATDSLRAALQNSAADFGIFELSAQAMPSTEAQDSVWEDWIRHNAACWTTPSILRAAGLHVVHTPSSERGPYHVDVRHPANTDEADVDIVIREFQCAFFGPDKKQKVSHEWISEDLRRLQQPSE